MNRFQTLLSISTCAATSWTRARGAPTARGWRLHRTTERCAPPHVTPPLAGAPPVTPPLATIPPVTSTLARPATCHAPTGRPATWHAPTGRPATCHAPTGRSATCHAHTGRPATCHAAGVHVRRRHGAPHDIYVTLIMYPVERDPITGHCHHGGQGESLVPPYSRGSVSLSFCFWQCHLSGPRGI